MEKKFILKDHQDSKKQILDEDLAKRVIADLCKKEPVEIIGRLDRITGEYTKRIIKSDGTCSLINDKNLEEAHHKRISKKLWRKQINDDNSTSLCRLIGSWTYAISPNDEESKFTLIVNNNQPFVGNYEEVKNQALQMLSKNPESTKLYFPSEKRIKKGDINRFPNNHPS